MESPRPTKRRRMSATATEITRSITPPSDHNAQTGSNKSDPTDDLLDRATHVLATEAAALFNITHLYRTDPTARQGLQDSVQAIARAQASGGKLIVTGVGKSGYIAQKLVATCKSLSIRASFLHACEALHGDLGDIAEQDVLLFVSFSGKTAELVGLLPHVPDGVRIVALTGTTRVKDCQLLRGRRDGVLLPAPIPSREEDSFGVAAPTTSTTVALAVADMLALTVAGQLHGSRTKEVFKRNHPGGAIGMSHREIERLNRDGEDFTVVELPSPSISGSDDG
ncbi:hypothetical protein LTR36_006384 [Oleoguttula mirabilis]|uniref:SIS domain-containing protein n=1 Tax=Oleoguttula mirabilis TaxID=1507867 RepID=A0AAV9JUJ3_9PEZI|nr:hypothetical protein LTR36_006384 [Oleoguttula mirabilis]